MNHPTECVLQQYQVPNILGKTHKLIKVYFMQLREQSGYPLYL